MTDQFLTRMFRDHPDFVFTVTRDFVKSCQTPVLVLPDDTAGHSLTVAIESAMLAPKGQLSMYPWKHPVEDSAGGAARPQLPAVASADLEADWRTARARLASQGPASWTQIVSWLRKIDRLRHIA